MGTTTYSIINECNIRSSITIFKLDADVLQSAYEDVHRLVQDTYYCVLESYPRLSRRKRGYIVRLFLSKMAESCPIYQEMFNEYL